MNTHLIKSAILTLSAIVSIMGVASAQQAPKAKSQAPKQEEVVIPLVNGSFEDTPRGGEVGSAPPAGWYDCGMAGQSAPDIQPGFFNVIKPASHGSTYIGLVVREDETWEAVGQRLSRPIEANKCYEFTIDLCRAEEYLSPTSANKSVEKTFGSAATIRVWGGNGFCDRAELLYTSPYIVNTRWLRYTIPLKPKKGAYNFIMIEAYYKTPVLFPYNGNVLLDNASAIKQVPCDQKKKDEPIAQVNKPKTPPTQPAKPPVTKAPPPPPVSSAPVKVDGPKTIANVDATKLKKGDVLQIQNLYFDADKYDIKNECIAPLNDVLSFLQKNPKISVEIGGHTNNRPADDFANRLSATRAQSVANWLISKGISASRIQYKGYGKTQPIAPNTTEEGRKKNQRVEIKILSVTG